MDPFSAILLVVICTSTFFSLAPQYCQHIPGIWHWMSRKCRKKNYRRRTVSVTANELSFYGICEYLSERCTDLKEEIEIEKVLDWNNDGHPTQKKMVLPKPGTYFEFKFLKVNENGENIEVIDSVNENNEKIEVKPLRVYIHNNTSGSDIDEFEFEYHKDNTKYFHNSLKPIYLRMGISMESIIKSLHKADFTEEEKQYMKDMEKKRNELYRAKENYYQEQKQERLDNITNSISKIEHKTNTVKLTNINNSLLKLKKKLSEIEENNENYTEIRNKINNLETNKKQVLYNIKLFLIQESINQLDENQQIELSRTLNGIKLNNNDIDTKINSLNSLEQQIN